MNHVVVVARPFFRSLDCSFRCDSGGRSNANYFCTSRSVDCFRVRLDSIGLDLIGLRDSRRTCAKFHYTRPPSARNLSILFRSISGRPLAFRSDAALASAEHESSSSEGKKRGPLIAGLLSLSISSSPSRSSSLLMDPTNTRNH